MRAPAVPQPTAPGDLVGVVLENTLTHAITPRYITFGTVFARGQLPKGEAITAMVGGKSEPAQIDVKNRYPDGSVLFGVVTLRAPAMASGADAPVMLRKAAPTPGTVAIMPALEKHDITITLALNDPGMPTRYVTVYAAKLLAQAQAAGQTSPWLAGPLVSETRVSRHIQGSLRLVLDIRAYATGSVAADVQLNNDIAMSPKGGTETYGIIIAQNGKPVFAVPHIHQFQYQDWHTIIRSGGRAPINVVHDVAAMERIGIVPAYELKVGMPRADLIAKLKAITAPGWDAPLAVDGVTQYMPMTGGRGSIGPTTAANAVWLITQNPVSAEYALGQADAAGAVPWHFFYEKTDNFVTTADFPKLWVDGRGGPASYTTGLTQQVDGKTGWTTDVAHEPDLSYIAYLLTGRRDYLDQQNAEADYSEVGQWPSPQARNNGEGIIVGPGEQVRGAAWSLREVADAAYIDPDGSPMRQYFQHMVSNNMDYLKQNIPVWTRQQGEPYGYIVGTYGSGTAAIAPWQQDYFASTMATMVRQGVPGARSTMLWEIHFLAGSVLTTTPGYNPRDGITYNMFVANPKTNQRATTWAEIEQDTKAGGQANGTGWAHSDGDYGMTRMAALAGAYNATNAAPALQGYEWVRHSGAPYTNVTGIQTTPQFWIVPETSKQ
ncbi:MAG: hypothetical protein B7Z58_16015 [Acidiphilium sp. 37-64-53]|nr:MAG: hypothetical protein B7Z58_16015 [Acidiphilium sp. 37-64-53]OZB25011.1 MAG: hypothetical protein B7X49_14035 [Acidiphilium sp. 34-64-41]